MNQVADMPYALYLSLLGKYFVGFAADVQFTGGRYGWAGLVNPLGSRVNLHVYVWTVTNFGSTPINTEIWFNADIPDGTAQSEYETPANTALCPLPQPRSRIMQINDIACHPCHGDMILTKTVASEVTIVGEEEGKFVFPPGGSLGVYIYGADASGGPGIGNVAFGWWEERINKEEC